MKGRGTGEPARARPARSPRPRLTSRAAVLAVVLCAIALSLAYPVREYIADIRQIGQLEALNAQLGSQNRQLRAERRALASPGYVEQLARDDLHMCFPSQTCYVVILPAARGRNGKGGAVTPWYERLWKSVVEADKVPAR
jgi:cell division protein FtsB